MKDNSEYTFIETKRQEKTAALISNIEKVIVGKHDVVFNAVAALLAGGHILIEDVPGVGKTMLAKAIAKSINAEFKRIQFTADLLPSDITGVNIYQQHLGEFHFRPGPIFTNVLLGDEINRATPRTQSSLLEAMEEYQVSVEGKKYSSPTPFFVIATQNPIELEGTYPLPFAQMDRFIIRLRLGYLDHHGEGQMVQERLISSPIDDLIPVFNCDDFLKLQAEVRQVKVSDDLIGYAVAIVQKSRVTDGIEYGASPRASIDLTKFSQALAFLRNRDYVLPDDIKWAAPLVLPHRLIIKRGIRHSTVSSEVFIQKILKEIEVPV